MIGPIEPRNNNPRFQIQLSFTTTIEFGDPAKGYNTFSTKVLEYGEIKPI
jgi:hypothetical protein